MNNLRRNGIHDCSQYYLLRNVIAEVVAPLKVLAHLLSHQAEHSALRVGQSGRAFPGQRERQSQRRQGRET